MTSIHILDDYSLLNIFYLYRPFILGEDINIRFAGGEDWVGERWWYRIAHVCQRWRSLILGSASHLGLFLVCTHGTPVANMLAHSPPLPLVIDYDKSDICRGRRGNCSCTCAARSCPAYPVWLTCSETAEAHHGHRRGISNSGIPDFRGSTLGQDNGLDPS